MDARLQIIKELHRPARRQFPRRATVIKGLNDLYQADIVEMIPYAKLNKGYKYILTVIDCFTKVANAIPLRTKSGREVSKAMEKILKEKRMRHLQTDEGKEYYNREFKLLMKTYSINHFSTHSEKKASIVERFNRTLKTSMFKNFSLRGSYVWYDVLGKLISEYNNKFHRTIGMKPIQVNTSNEALVLKRIKSNTIPKVDKIPPHIFKIGDKVRISKYKHVFSKGYLPNWTNEVFTIHRIQPTNPETYLLKDSRGELLLGSFYGHEISKSNTGDVYLVEKVLRRKGDKVLVRWLGFNKQEDSWISKKDLV